MLFSTLFIDPYYTSPKNVITNVIPLLLVYLPIKSFFSNQFIWSCSIYFLLVLLAVSVLAMALKDNNKSDASFQNKTSNFLKRIAVIFGRGKILYSFVFLYFFLLQYSIDNNFSFFMIATWLSIINIDAKYINNNFFRTNDTASSNKMGEIFSVDSKKMFLIKLLDYRKDVEKFDLIRFRYSMDSNDSEMEGIIFDTYFLNQEKWAKALQLSKSNYKSKLPKNSVYRISDKDEQKTAMLKMNVKRFVGVISSGSQIGKIKFIYSKETNDLQEGDLLELNIEKNRIFYQVVNGETKTEKLEDKNEFGSIVGEAVQLGEWQSKTLSFQKFGWVPEINTPVFKADTSDIRVEKFDYPYYELGNIPGTTLPSVINLDEAVSHHMAILGITGSGKSFLAREIVKKLASDTMIICVDFTGEWARKMTNDGSEYTVLNKENIDNFLKNNKGIGIVELPDMSNTVRIIEATENLFSIIFNFAKKNYDNKTVKKICLILEEAHTIVPESSFLGVNNFDSKAIVNKMGQIALQGRKYGVGLLIIAQRTANVSKTVLTQCNTVICFQAFDDTSFGFIGNYVGQDLVKAIPNLRQYYAIVTGKAMKSNIPMIVNLSKQE